MALLVSPPTKVGIGDVITAQLLRIGTALRRGAQELVGDRPSRSMPVSPRTQPQVDQGEPIVTPVANSAPSPRVTASDTPMHQSVREKRLETQIRGEERWHSLSSDVTERWTAQEYIGAGAFGSVWKEQCQSGSSRGAIRAVKKISKDQSPLWARELHAFISFSDPALPEVSPQSPRFPPSRHEMRSMLT